MDFGKMLSDGFTGALGGLAGGPLGIVAGLLTGVAPDLFSTFLPHLAGSHGEDVAGAVISAVATATGIEKPTPADVKGLSPDARAALQAQLATIAMQAEKNRLDDLASERAAEIAKLQASLIDTQSARSMEETLAASHSALAYGSVVVSVVIIAAFGTTLICVLTGHVPEAASGAFGSVVMGTLTAMATQVANYWLGSSSGSRGKDLALANSMPVPQSMKKL
jgi:hypothetical protein